MSSLPVLAMAIVMGCGVFLVLEAGLYLLRRRGSRLGRTVSSHLWAMSLGLLSWVLVLQPESPNWVRVLGALAVMLSAWVIFRLADELVLRRPWDRGRGAMMPKLARDVLGLTVLVGTGIVVATTILDQPLPAVLVSSTVISAVIGLALQDTLKNVFAGMALELEGTFARGDWLLLDGEAAQVQDTTWRSVKLRTAEGLEIFVPSGEFSSGRITRLGAGLRPIAVRVELGLGYDAAPGRAKEILCSAAASASTILASPAPEAYVVEYGESAVLYRVRAWTRNVHQLTRVRDQVASRIWYALRREGLAVPFPIRTTILQSAERQERRQEETGRHGALESLRSVSLFRPLPEPAREALAASARRMRYDEGEVLFREEEAGDTLLVIEEGRVAVSKREDAAGLGDVDLGEIGPGGFFGEMAMLTGERRSATVTAKEDCTVLVIPRSALAPLLEEDPELAERLSAEVVERRRLGEALLEDRAHEAHERAGRSEEGSVLDRIRKLFKL